LKSIRTPERISINSWVIELSDETNASAVRLAAFLKAACVPRTHHDSGTLDEARAILANEPDLPRTSIYAAAVLGADAIVADLVAADAACATTMGGPYDWDALTHLCFSRFLKLEPARSEEFVRAATTLLDAGASANTGFYERDHHPAPEFESAIYGAAGVAHHAALTRLLLDRGADPNDAETPYHAPETYDNEAVRALVESGKLTDASLATMLLRKADWHDYHGIEFLLANGADPNRMTPFCYTALQQALRRDNALPIIELFVDGGADPTLPSMRERRSAIEMAVRRGRGDVLEAFARRGIPIELDRAGQLMAACATNDSAAIQSIRDRKPELVAEVVSQGGELLGPFAANGNAKGARHLLDLGIDVAATYSGDPYFGIAKGSTALHAAAWLARHVTVKFLIEHGAPVDARDERGRTPLALAVRACVDSYWTRRRSPESVAALLAAGASVDGVMYPSGYAEVDELLSSRIPT
jgi:ankyrin repeat protein